MLVSTILGFIAIVAVSIEMPVTAAVFGALAFYAVGHIARLIGARRADLAENSTGPLSLTGPLFGRPGHPRLQMVDLKAAAATKLTAGVCSLVPRLPMVAPVSHGSRNGSGHRSQPAIGIRVCAKQTLANGLGHQR